MKPSLHLQEWVDKNNFTPKELTHEKIMKFVEKEFSQYSYIDRLLYGIEAVEREERFEVGGETYYVTILKLKHDNYIITSTSTYYNKISFKL